MRTDFVVVRSCFCSWFDRCRAQFRNRAASRFMFASQTIERKSKTRRATHEAEHCDCAKFWYVRRSSSAYPFVFFGEST